jgi:hypothetical protein
MVTNSPNPAIVMKASELSNMSRTMGLGHILLLGKEKFWKFAEGYFKVEV